MKLLLTSDLHSKRSNLDIIEKCLIQLNELAKNVESTIILGDLVEEKGYFRVESLNLYLKYFSNWPNKLYLLPGNHDLTNNKSNEHALSVFSLLPNIVVTDCNYKENNFSFLPYSEDIDYIKKFIDQQPNDNIIFTHLEISNFYHDNDYKSTSKISKDIFNKFKIVFSGHLHKAQEDGNIIYVGSPFTTSFGEANENKRVVIYDTITNKCKNIYLDLPQHKIFEYEIKELDDVYDIKEDLNKNIKLNYIVRLILNVDESIYKKIKVNLFQEFNINSFKINNIKPTSNEIKISESLDYEKMVLEYLKISNIDNKDMIDINREILNEVK